MERRVAITGIGVISPIGNGKKEFFDSLYNGRSGIDIIHGFDVSRYSSKTGGEVKKFDAECFLGQKGLRYLNKPSKFISAASKLALSDANIIIDNSNEKKAGLITGSTYGSLQSVSTFYKEALNEGYRYVNPMLFPNTMLTTPSSYASIYTNIKGINRTISNGETSGLDAVIYAYNLIKTDIVDICLAGGTEEISEELFDIYYYNKLLSNSHPDYIGEEICAPYDKRRNGTILGEGSGVVVLEDLEHAKKRNAHIYAEVVGTGSFYETPEARIKKDGYGIKKAIKIALDEAGLSVDSVDFVVSTANSDINLDRIESAAINEIFKSNTKLKINSIKSYIGETIGASGGMQLCSGMFSMNENSIPAVLNYLEKDSQCYMQGIESSLVKHECNIGMCNSMGYNGNNASLIFKRLDN